ncbi:MAG: hypothetical protein VR67_06245 [Peptococcaceae bacterium BRH_c8a]|nr:MAG: hypothetical protein VR67_06245 [Peptococcaceae bacterium BRH_c8a]
MSSTLARSGRILALFTVIMFSAGMSIFLHVLPARAETSWTVTNTSDSASDTGSLRYAMTQAQYENGGTITFASGLTGTIQLSGPLPTIGITRSLTIEGPGAENLTIDGQNQYRVFQFNSGNVTIKNLTVANGKVTGSTGSTGGTWGTGGTGGTGAGGAVYNAGTLNISGSQFSNNSVTGGTGGTAGSAGTGGTGGTGAGGVVYNTGTLNISGSQFSNNSANGGTGGTGGSYDAGGRGGIGEGGAVYNTGTLTIINSQFSGNSGTGGTGGNSHYDYVNNGGNGEGGAVYSAETMTISNSQFTGNSATGGKGGYSYYENGGRGGNGEGGAMYSAGTMTISDSQFSSNIVSGGTRGGSHYGSGGSNGVGYAQSIYNTGTIAVNKTDGDVTFDFGNNSTHNVLPSAGWSTVTASSDTVPPNSTATITVTLLDANQKPISNKEVILAANSGSSSSITGGGITNSNGQVTFGVTNAKEETVTYTATETTDTPNILLVGTAQVTFAVGSATQLVWHTTPSNGTAGTALATQPVLYLEDSGGNVVISDNSTTVTLTASGGQTLIGNTETASSGVVTYTNLSTENAGTFTLSASAGSDISSSNDPQITIAPSAAYKLAWTPEPPAIGTAGSPLSPAPAVSLEDQYGNVITGDSSSTATVWFADANGAPAGVSSTVPLQNGVAIFNDLAINQAGTYNLTPASSLSSQSGIISPVSNPFTVTAGPVGAGKSTVSASSSSLTANGSTTSTITVILKDEYDNPVSGETVTLEQGGGHSTVTAVSGVSGGDGTAVFNVTNTRAEAVTYTAMADGVTLSQTATVNFTVGPAAQLVWHTQPGGAASGEFLSPQPVLYLEDQYGNVVTGDSSSTVTVWLTSANGATLSGTTRVTLQNGEAAFSDLSVNKAGSYTLTPVSSLGSQFGIISPVSSSFNIGAGSTSSVLLSVSPSSVPADGATAATLNATIYDNNNNPVPGTDVTFSSNLGSIGTPSTVVSDIYGQAANAITSTTAGTADVQVSCGGQTLSAQVVFIPTMAVTNMSPSFGPAAGGTPVTVEGTGLDKADAVYFGSVAGAVYESPSSSELLVYTPAAPPGGGSVNVVVYGPGGPSAQTPAALFNYLTPVPKPTLVPDGGTFTGPVDVAIEGITDGDTAYYNLGNSVPTTASMRYVGPFTIGQSTSVTAAVYDLDYGEWSQAVTANFIFNSTISPFTATFDLNTGGIGYADVPVTLTLNGNTLTDIKNGITTLTQGTDYTVTGSTVIIKKNYLAAQNVGTTTLTFDFSAGATETLDITVEDTTPIADDDGDGGAGGGTGGGGGGGGAPAPANYASKLIDAAADGSVRFGSATVEVPAGTLPANATLKVKQLTDKEDEDLVPSNLRVKLGSDIYDITTTGERNFGDKTLTIRIAYAPTKIAEGEQPVIRYRDETSGEWGALPTTVEQGADGKWYAVTHVNHLTNFAVFGTVVQEPDMPVIKLTIGQQEAAVDDRPYTLDAAPFLDTQTYRTLVPLRFVSETLGAKVDWLAETGQVNIVDDGGEIILTTGSRDVLVNGQKTSIDCVPVVLPPGRTFVPLRFVSETLGATVDYVNATKEIIIKR